MLSGVVMEKILADLGQSLRDLKSMSYLLELLETDLAVNCASDSSVYSDAHDHVCSCLLQSVDEVSLGFDKLTGVRSLSPEECSLMDIA